MIRATDLRIGNYVNVPNVKQCPFRIDVFEFMSIKDCKVGMIISEDKHPLTWWLEALIPIPLTEELLLKFGNAKKTRFPNEINVYNRFRFIWKEGYKYWYVIFLDSKEYLTKIEFVHEYQQFIFILTGKELTIKL